MIFQIPFVRSEVLMMAAQPAMMKRVGPYKKSL